MKKGRKKVKHNFYAEYDNIVLRPLGVDDIEKLRVWRNDTESTKFLRDIGHITEEMQKQWFDNYLSNPNEVIFAIEETSKLNRMIGSLSLYEINRENLTSEIGKIQIGDSEAHGMGIGRKSLVMAMKVAFKFFALNKIVGSVHQENIQAHTNDMKVGFQIVGQTESVVGGIEDLIEITENQVSKVNPYYYDIIVKDLSERQNRFYVGQEGRFSKTIEVNDVYNFAGITGDFNPLHINEVAASDSIFGKRVVHGMLVSSLFSTVIGMVMPGLGSIYLSQESSFIKPVFIGDTITAIVTIVSLDEKNRATLRTEVINQRNERVIIGTAKVILPKE